MSDTKKPVGAGELPPPIDPDNVREVCANDVFSIEIGGGMATFVFGKRELREVGNGQPPKIERRVTNKLVLSCGALDDMMKKLLTMNRAMNQHEMLLKDPKKPN